MNEPPAVPPSAARLNVGCGRSPIPGWVNVDLQILPGVDAVVDVTAGLCFEGVAAVFAEHFLEHLALDEAIRFLEEAHRILEPEGWLRLSTPNLEWVLATHYRPADAEPDGYRGTVDLNRAFYGWEHRFLWDRNFLTRALEACGFTEPRWPGYGESDLPFFRGLEAHERSEDYPGLPHVLIVEARKGPSRPEDLAELTAFVRERFLGHLEEARLRRARLDIERLHREVARLHEELQRVSTLHREARATIGWMEQSRFWKVRNLWFKWKATLGLVPREE